MVGDNVNDDTGEKIAGFFKVGLMFVLVFFSILGLTIGGGNHLSNDLNTTSTTSNQNFNEIFGIDINKHQALIPIAESILSDGLIANNEWLYLKKQWHHLLAQSDCMIDKGLFNISFQKSNDKNTQNHSIVALSGCTTPIHTVQSIPYQHAVYEVGTKIDFNIESVDDMSFLHLSIKNMSILEDKNFPGYGMVPVRAVAELNNTFLLSDLKDDGINFMFDGFEYTIAVAHVQNTTE